MLDLVEFEEKGNKGLYLLRASCHAITNCHVVTPLVTWFYDN